MALEIAVDRRIDRALLLAWTCAAGLLHCGFTNAAEAAGFVLSMQGRWSVQGSSTPLTVGAALAPDARLVASMPGPFDHIVVISARSGAVLVSSRCGDAGACIGPTVVPRPSDAGPDTSPLSKLMNRIVARIAGEPDRYVSTLSRGVAAPEDAVVEWSDQGVDFSPVLLGLPEANYRLKLSKLNCEQGSGCRDAPFIAYLNWSIGDAPMVPIGGLSPGLYELTLSRDGIPGQSRCWLLLSPAAELGTAVFGHRAALALVHGWGALVPSTVKRTFVRAVLDALAAR